MESELLKSKVENNKIHSIIFGQIQAQNDQQKALLFYGKLPQIREYIDDLYLLAEKLEQINQSKSTQMYHLKNQLKSALRYCEMMRRNTIHPLQPHEFTETEAIEYRVLSKLYFKNQTFIPSNKTNSLNSSPQKNSPQSKGNYFTAIQQLAEYNVKLKQNMEFLAKYRQVSNVLQSLNGTISYLKQQNYFLKKQNTLLQERGENYLSIKKLCESQESLIKDLEKQLELKRQQIREVIGENSALNDRLHFYKNDDLQSEKKLSQIKADFLNYFQSKKNNYNSQAALTQSGNHVEPKFY